MKDHLIFMKKLKPALLHFVHRRTKVRNQNCLIAFTGGTGSGKSYSSISFAQSIAKKNDVEFDSRHICFTSSEFMRLINSGELKRGSVIILDEAGVAVNAKKWQSQINIVMSYIVQTFRHRNYVVILNSPSFDFIDKSIRKMFHMWVATETIDFTNKVAWVRPYVLQVDQRNGDVKTWFIRVKMPYKAPVRVERTGFRLASQDLLDKYENKKLSFTDALNKKVEETLLVEEGGEAELTEGQELCLILWNDYGLKQYEIAKVMGKNQGMVSKSLKTCKKKGHVVNRGSAAKSKMSDDDLKQAYERALAKVEANSKARVERESR